MEQPEQVSLAVKDAEKRIAGLQDILVSVQKRRNEAIAHLDPGTVVDPAGLESRAKLTIPDLKKVFDETSAVLNGVMRLWQDTYAYLEFIGSDDYKTALELIAEAKTRKSINGKKNSRIYPAISRDRKHLAVLSVQREL